MTSLQALLLPGVVLASLVAHAVAYGVMPEPASPAQPPALVEVTIAETAPKPAPPPAREPTPLEVATDPEPVRTAVARRPRATPPAPPPTTPAAPPPAESPADFTGTTLTNDGPGEGWATATGNGERMTDPIGAPGARRAPVARTGRPGGTGTDLRSPPAPRVVRVGDLARRPRAPDLNDQLATNYPRNARQQGKPGRAVVRARIEPNGRARVLRVVSESGEQFGVACRRTLDGSRWDPPRDRQGRPVATELDYTCRFEVGS